MYFTSPAGLLLLLLIPFIVVMGWPARGFARRREIFSLGLRLIILICLILALAGLEVGRASSGLAVVFLVDRSDSMGSQAQAAALDYVRQSLASMGPDDQAAVVAFGRDALVERPMSSARELVPFSSVPNSSGTDYSAAIRLGLALYPPEMARRMVILSDGLATQGEALDTARLAAAQGVQILALPFLVEPGAEVLVTSVEVPGRLREGEKFELLVTIESRRRSSAVLRVLANGLPVYQSEEPLEEGSQSFSLPLIAGEPGFYRYQVQIDAPEDGYYQNNELAAFSQVEGPPRVLLVAARKEEGTLAQEAVPLQEGLRAAGLDLHRVSPSEFPSNLEEMSQYSALVLANLPARELSQRQMNTIQAYVRDLGGGLVVVGGPSSYGVGGYYRTPLEDTLPVEMQIKDEARRPSVTLVFVIDHSGSMAEISGGATKLDLAKEAAIRSIDLLFPGDRVGIVTFDDTASWAVPITGLSDPSAVKNAIASIRSGGGTDILAGVRAVAQELPSDPGNVKHVILLTDGGADPAGIPELVQQLHTSNGITLTTVGVGTDAAPYLADLANLGGGRYHFTPDPGAIPSIFTAETSLATRSYLVEHPFLPVRASASPILSGIQALPELQGYVATSVKSTAQTVLVSDLGDPILATWQYGLGKAVAFTSDAAGRWAQSWIDWDRFPSFWGQAVSFALREQTQGRVLDLRVVPPGESSPGGQATLLVEAQRGEGQFLNGYRLSARLVPPQGETEELALEQTAPGRYQVEFTPRGSGAYLISISGQPGDSLGTTEPTNERVAETAGWILPYSPEYQLLEPDPQLLSQMAGFTGGGIAPQDPGEIFLHDLPSPRATRPAWPWLLALAALLLPLDIGVRRLVFSANDLRRVWMVLKSWKEPGERAAAPAAPRSQQIEALMQAKGRARQMGPPGDQTREPASEQKADFPSLAPSGPSGPPDGRNASSKLSEDDIESTQSSTASMLLKRKREKRQDRS